MNRLLPDRQTLLKILLFVSVPLFLEVLVYLVNPEIYPGYLTLKTQASSLPLALFYLALVFLLASSLIAIILPKLPVKIEPFITCCFFALFLALTLGRLLPRDSGFSIARVFAFAFSVLLSICFYIVLSKREISTVRLFTVNCLYCGISAFLLGHLFAFPLRNIFTAALFHVAFFSTLVFLPGKLVAAGAVLIFILQFQSRTTLPRFAAPVKLQPYKRVIFVGVDGMDPRVAFQLAKAGEMPTLEKMRQGGLSSVVHTLRIPFSPLIWNSIYTGTRPQDHGIMAFTFTKITGAKPWLSLWLDNRTNSDWIHRSVGILRKMGFFKTASPALSKHRLRPALWNMVEQNSAASIVVGGWTTYPPEIIKGTYVSDYALMPRAQYLGSYYPVSKEIENLLAFRPDTSTWPSDLQRYLSKDERAHHLSMNLLQDASDETRLFFSYYCSIDAFGHHYGTKINMKSTSISDRKRYSEISKQIYKKIDHYLGDLLPFVDDRTLLIVCSDHGFQFDKRQHNYPVDGILLMYGKNVRAETTIEAGIYNLAPTILYALGMPLDSGFVDVPLRQAFTGIIKENPLKKYIRTNKFFEVMADKEFEKQKMEELIDLQYINR